MEKYIMSEEEYLALDKVLMKSHLIDGLDVTQVDDEDCFMDFEQDKVISFKDGLQEIYESDANDICFKNGYITHEEHGVINSLFKKFEIM